MKRFNIIFIGLARWDGKYSSTAVSIASELGKKHNLFYVENPYTLLDFLKFILKWKTKHKWRAFLTGHDSIRYQANYNFHSVIPPLIIPINWLPKGIIYNQLHKLNNFLFNKSILKINNLIDNKEVIIINSFNPFYGNNLPNKLNVILKIYQSVDNMQESEYIKHHGPVLEEKSILNSDFTITTSTSLLNKISKIKKEVYLIPNAANIEIFKQCHNPSIEKPTEITHIKTKIIVYMGNICKRINYQLLTEVAKYFNNYTILLIGPISVNNSEIKTLMKFENVIFTGPKKPNELPQYLKFSDCAIIPFLCNELTADIYPLKINEYLASGLPVVSSSFSFDILSFNSMISIAENNIEFIKLIKKEIKLNSKHKKEERLEYVLDNNWENRTKTLESLILDEIKKR